MARLTQTAIGGKPKDRNDDWATPQALVDWLKLWFILEVDVCASADNNKLAAYWTKDEDALSIDWHKHGGGFYMNPPYSQVSTWMNKAYQEAQQGATVLCLVPASTDTRWWTNAFIRALPIGKTVLHCHVTDWEGRKWIVLKGMVGEVWFSPCRINFEHPNGENKSGNTKGSTLFVFYGSQRSDKQTT